MTCWIKTIAEKDARGKLRDIYDRVKSPHGTVDRVYQAQSLMPETIAGHDALYKSILHNPHNRLAGWFLEAVAVYTSLLNHCRYAAVHHGHNMRVLCGDQERGEICYAALACDRPQDAFAGKHLELMKYVRKLTRAPAAIEEADIDTLRTAGATDREILEVNQVCAGFNYSVRVLNGLGVSLEGDVIGFYDAPPKS